MKMSKKVREYKAGDFIFAKVKGYPAWPARVQRPNGKKYFVYFYGTGETANLPPNMIFDYAENKDKFLSKAVKRRDFNDGVKQIEHDFANNVPLEQVIGVAMEVLEETANDTANESAVNDTVDDSVADTTAADTTAAEDTTVADESAVNTTSQNEPMVEDSDDAGALVIDEGKKGRKSTAKQPATPKAMREPKTPRGKKKEEADENKEEEKKDEEIVSRSGRKIRPKRYIDEQTEENTTLPSPAPKKRRGASPTVDKEDKAEKSEANNKSDKTEKSGKQLNTVTQSELEDLKEPFTSADDKENILIAYLPEGQYVGIKLFQSRPATFKSESVRLQWDKQQAQNAITLKQQLEKGQITSQSVITQLVMDLNLTDEEKATLDKERETEEKKSRVQFLKTEMKLIELEAKIKTCLCLEKADTELCLKLLDEFTELDIKPLMLLKHPSCGETVKRLRAYVGNAPSWELSESAALLFAKQAHRIRRRADALYRRVKELFTVPEGLSFWEFFSDRVEQFKKVTEKLSPDELLELVHEPLEMSLPTSHTMKASVEAANEEESIEDDSSPKKKTAAKQKKPANNNTPSKPAVKRQSSRKQQEEKEKEKEQNSEQEKSEEAIMENAEKESKDANKAEEKVNTEDEKDTDKTVNSNEEVNSQDSQDDNSKKDSTDAQINSDKDDAVTTNDNSSEKDNKTNNESDKVNKSKEESEKASNNKDESEKASKNKDESEKATKNKDESEKASKNKDESEKTNKNKDESEKASKSKNNSNKEQSKSKSPSPNEKEKDISKSPKEAKGNDSAKSTKDDKADKQRSKEDKVGKEEKTDKTEEKDKEDEPRAKRSRESKKTDVPPRSPTKRKSKF